MNAESKDVVEYRRCFSPKRPVSAINLYRFWSKTEERKGDDCIYWIGSMHRQGYGFTYDSQQKKIVKAHRFAASVYLDNFDSGLCVLHRCDNTSCVNPEHLFQGTQADNIHDMVRKGRQSSGQTYR